MEKGKYYPLRVGKYTSVIVSDVDTKRPDYGAANAKREVEHYGGFIIAESLPPDVAEDIVQLYNEKYAPKSAHSFTEGFDQYGGSKPSAAKVYITNNRTEDFFSKSLIKEMSIEKQIEWISDVNRPFNPVAASVIKENLLAIKHWNESPVYHNVDVVKVIEDLIEAFVSTYPEGEGRQYAETKHTAVQNANAALGMLQAFKEKRCVNKERYPYNRDAILRQVEDQLPPQPTTTTGSGVSPNFKTANAIIFAIESILGAKNL